MSLPDLAPAPPDTPDRMPPSDADPHAAVAIVVFTIGLIALMQAVAWVRQREPGMLWFSLASLISTVLLATGLLPLQGGAGPGLFTLLSMYAVRGLFALGLTDCLDDTPRMRRLTVAVLVFPLFAFGAALLAGVGPKGLWAALPMFWVDTGLALACLAASRRHPGAGHGFVALAPLTGPLSVVLDLATGGVARPGLHFLIGAIGFGIIALVVGLMRRTADSRLAQAQAQRMSNYYAAVSRTNQAIGRIAEPVALYEAVCAICVDVAQARLASVFVAEGDMARRVAAAGPVARLFEALPNPWDTTTPDGSASLAARCLRTGRRMICDDVQKTPPVTTWLQRDLAHGFHAMAFLPVRRGGHTVATLMIASGEPDIFDAALVRLLDEMTDDISNALDHFDREAERLESARQVKAGLDRFTRLFEVAPVPATIVSIDDRRVVDVNSAMCEVHHTTRDALIGRTTDKLAHRSVIEDRERFYETLAREGRVRNMVVRMVDTHGRPRVELVNAEPIEYLGRPCAILMNLDISDMQAAENTRAALAQAQSASHAKTQFLSSMSHELRTPLNAVLGFSSLLRHEAADRLAPRQLEQLDHIQQAGWHLLRLINDVLDVSRIEAGQLGVDLRGVELAPLLDEALQMSQPPAMRARITLRAHYRDAAPAWVLADATRLRQVMLNLLSNATKYNREDGSVDISVIRRDGHVEIEVADTGLGMDADQLAHLFEPFNRLGRERQGFEGTGIGLALARQLMLLMNGQVHVTSEPGRGTRVVLILPDAIGHRPGTSAAPAPPEPLDADAVPPRGTVLYIEDNVVNTLLVEQLLARWSDVRFVAAADGATGLQVAAALRPDLVLLDMQLPDLDGMLVLQRLREHPDLRDTPVIVLSANAMPEEIALARSQGATDYWTKPLDFQRFLAGVARTLASRLPAV